jgi:hypothetical protein
MKEHVAEGHVQIDDLEWQLFPEGLAEGGIKWKLLNVSPEMGAWTATFDCPAGSSFAPHIHMGPGEYFYNQGQNRHARRQGCRRRYRRGARLRL